MLVAAMACFSASDALAKYLTGMLPVAVIVWVRYLAFMVTLIPLLQRGRSVLRTQRLWLHGIRSIALAASASFFILALRVLPMAEATALVFASPLFVTILSAWLLVGKAPRLAWTFTTLLMFLLTIGQSILMKPDVNANWQYLILTLICAALSDPESASSSRTVREGAAV